MKVVWKDVWKDVKDWWHRNWWMVIKLTLMAWFIFWWTTSCSFVWTQPTF